MIPPILPPPAFGPLPGLQVVPVATVLSYAGPLATATQAASAWQPGDALPQFALEAAGWMLCDGRSLNAGDYHELFNVLGYLYGGSNSHFNIPDYRGYFLRGADPLAHIDPDAATRTPPAGSSDHFSVGSTQTDALETHEHIYMSAPAPAQPSSQGTAAGAAADAKNLTQGGPTNSLTPPGSVRVSQAETRPVNVYVNFIVKTHSGHTPTVFRQPAWP